MSSVLDDISILWRCKVSAFSSPVKTTSYKRKTTSCVVFVVCIMGVANLYCHNGSFSHPTGKLRALLSISGNVAKRLFIFSSVSLPGDMMSMKYLMMQRSKYTLNGSVGKEIQGRDILIGMVALIENVLFQIRE